MQHRMYWPRKGLIRRITQVSEVSVMGEHVLLNDLFTFSHENDKVDRTVLPSGIIERLSFLTGLKLNELKDELFLRTAILDSLVKKKIFDYEEIKGIIYEYNVNPSKLVKNLNLK